MLISLFLLLIISFISFLGRNSDGSVLISDDASIASPCSAGSWINKSVNCSVANALTGREMRATGALVNRPVSH